MQRSPAASKKPLSRLNCFTKSCMKRSRATAGSGSDAAASASATTSSMRVWMIASISSSLVGKRRNSVASPTPARWAISAVAASRPRSAKTAAAAAMMRSRLRAASARRALGGDWDRISGVDPCNVALSQQDRKQHRAQRDQARGHKEGQLVAVDEGGIDVALARPADEVTEHRGGAIVRERRQDGEAEGAANLLGGVEDPGREARVVVIDVGRRHERQRDERR